MNELLGRFSDTLLHAALYDHSGESFKYMICYNVPKGLEIPESFTKSTFAVRKSAKLQFWRGFNSNKGTVLKK